MRIDLAILEPAPARGVEGGDRRIDRTQAMAIARQETEVLAQFVVHALGCIGRDTHQLVGRVGHELRIGTQEGDEFFQRAFESGLLLGLFHLGGDPRDLS